MNDKIFESVLEKFRTVKFFRRGYGLTTIAEAVKYHEALAERLSKPPYVRSSCFVSPEQIDRAAAWTLVNQNKGKKQIGKFLLNWYNTCVKRGDVERVSTERWW